MTDNWSCLEPEATTPYADICREAVEDNEVFKSLKELGFKINVQDNTIDFN